MSACSLSLVNLVQYFPHSRGSRHFRQLKRLHLYLEASAHG